MLHAMSAIAQEAVGVQVERKLETFAPGSNLIIYNPHGSIHIQGWDEGRLSVQAHRDGKPVDDAFVEIKRLADGIEVNLRHHASRRFLGNLFGLLPPKKIECDLTISAPRRVAADISAVNGSIDIFGLDGLVKCETVNGRIQLQNIAGQVEAKTINGSIAAVGIMPTLWERHNRASPNRLAGLRAESINGSIQLERLVGGARANTTHGHIGAKQLDGQGQPINLESISGNINIELTRAATELATETMVGNIDIQLPNIRILEEGRNKRTVFIPGRPNQMQRISLKTVNGKITVR